jgi:peptidyl-prolyl cis-trans isomerase SurA
MKIGYSFKLFILTLGLCSATMITATPKMVDRIAAVVNHDVILESSVNQMFMALKTSTHPSELPNDATLRHQVLERLIVDNLILQKADKAQTNVTEQDLNNAISRIAQQNNISLYELKAHLARSNISFDQYRNRIRNEMIIEQTRMNEVRRRINISPQEVDNLAKIIAEKPNDNIEVNISHILIATPESPTRDQLIQAQNKANMIVKKLNAGESFALLAASYSNDDLALSGGKLGWKRINELPSLFEDKLIRAPKGKIIGPVRSNVGFHILKVNDNRTKAKQTVTVNEVNARHILLKTSIIFDDNQAKEKLSQIRHDILNNATTFQAAAKAYSEDPGSKNNGGELGWSMPEQYDESFRNALLKLKKGEISRPVKSAFGWHIIQLLDSRKQDKTEAAYKEQAYRMIFNRKFAEESQVWIQELRSDAYINIIDDTK